MRPLSSYAPQGLGGKTAYLDPDQPKKKTFQVPNVTRPIEPYDAIQMRATRESEQRQAREREEKGITVDDAKQAYDIYSKVNNAGTPASTPYGQAPPIQGGSAAGAQSSGATTYAAGPETTFTTTGANSGTTIAPASNTATAGGMGAGPFIALAVLGMMFAHDKARESQKNKRDRWRDYQRSIGNNPNKVQPGGPGITKPGGPGSSNVGNYTRPD